MNSCDKVYDAELTLKLCKIIYISFKKKAAGNYYIDFGSSLTLPRGGVVVFDVAAVAVLVFAEREKHIW